MSKTGTSRLLGAVFLGLMATATAAAAQDLASMEKRTSVRTLPNGLTLIVVERPEAPVFSFFTHVDAGSAQEVPGITGLAHMFEHMAFKGTDIVGTKDYAAEKAALARVETAYAAYLAERRKTTGRDDKRVAQLEKAWKDAISEADKFVVSNEFDEIVQRAGGVGMNAFTSSDETGYFYSMPSNGVELWAYLESERFMKPTMREFYKERDVVMEERRMRTDSNPIGKLVEQFLGAAFKTHPYGMPTVGTSADLQSFSATDGEAFFKTYYVPANMVVSVVGDVKAATVMPMLEKYFGRLPKRPEPAPLRAVEPVQTAERVVTLRDASQPIYIEGYHRPDSRHADNAVYDAISDLMSSGRTSRLHRSLVRDKKIAAQTAGFNGFPGDKYPHLFAFFGVPTPGHTNAEVRDAIRAEIERLKTQDVTDEELRMVKTRAKANLLRQLDSNQGLALQFGTAQTRFGDWRAAFRQVDAIDKVSKQDIRRVAAKTFVAANRTVGQIESIPAAKAEGSK